MKNSTAPAADTQAAVGSPIETEDIDDDKARFEHLKRSVRVTKALLHAVADSRKLLDTFSASFLEQLTEDKDAPQEKSARQSKQKDAAFAAAKAVLEPDHPIKKSMEASLASLTGLDAAIEAAAQEVSKILEQQNSVIAQALKDAAEPQSAEFIEEFSATLLALTGEMDARAQEIATLTGKCKTELLEARINRLATTRNIVLIAVILTVLIIGSVGYVAKKRAHAKAQAIEMQARMQAKLDAIAQAKALQQAALQARAQAAAAAAAKLVPAATAASATQASSADSKLDTPSSGNGHAAAEASGGEISVSSGQDKATMKKNVQALGEIIREWNAENGVQPLPEKAPKK